MDRYTQGSVLYGLRSQYYENIKCYGIIITARCEIAQGKAKVIHAISAMSLRDWVRTELFSRVFYEYLNNDILGVISNWARDKSLDFETLLSFGPQKVLKNIQDDETLKPKAKQQLEKSVEEWEKWNEITLFCDEKTKDTLLDSQLSKRKSALLKELLTGKFPNEFCFIPDSARKPNGSKVEGIVANLKDILQISVEEIEEIQNFGFDYEEICKSPQGSDRIRDLNNRYYLNTDDDFVTFDYSITSPWIEHLIQNFSNSFARIGVDTASSSEISSFCAAYRLG